MLNDVTISHLVSNPSLLSSSSLLILYSCIQHDNYCRLVMETSRTAKSIHLESIRYTHTICHTHLQHQLIGGKVSVHRERSPAWHSLQGQSCGDVIPQTP